MSDYNLRLLATRKLKEIIIDVGMELEDIQEARIVHEQYKPNGTVYSAWVGTTQEWNEEWQNIKDDEREVIQQFETLHREYERRRQLTETRTAITASAKPSERRNIVILEDIYAQRRSRPKVQSA